MLARTVETALRTATGIVTGFATKRQVFALQAGMEGTVLYIW